MERPSNRNKWWIGAEATLMVALVGLPWALGGAPEWVLWPTVLLSGTACFLWFKGAARHSRRVVLDPMLLVPLLAIAVMVFQLIPLPQPLLRTFGPESAELREFALIPLGLTSWRPITVDAPATLRALSLTIALGGFLFVSLQIGRMPIPRGRLLAIAAITGGSVVICGVGHLLAGADSLFGFYTFTSVRLQTPFGNTNHLAAYLSITGTVALALALTEKKREEVVGWAIAAVACGLAVFLSFSRGGIGSFVLTWCAVGAMLLSRRTGGFRGAIPWVVMGVTIIFAGLLSAEQLLERAASIATLEKLRSSKVEWWPMFALSAANVWPMGMGRGAFELGFSRHQTQSLDVTFTHPENLPLQWLNEVGIPMSLLLAGLAGWALLRLWRAANGQILERTVLLGIGGLLVHDFFDFSLELPAVSVTAAICLGLAASPHSKESAKMVVQRSSQWIAPLVVSVALAAAWVGLPSHHAAEDALALAIQPTVGGSTRDVRAVGLQGIDRHPSDYVLYGNLARWLAAQSEPRETLAWVNRLLFLRPADAKAHATAAQALARLGQRKQAMGECRLAFQDGEFSALPLALALAAKEGDYERLFVPKEGMLTAATAELRQRKQVDAARKLLDRALAEPPSEDVRVEALSLLAEVEADGGDAKKALTLIDSLPEDERKQTKIILLRTQVLAKLGRIDEAVTMLDKMTRNEPDNAGVANTLFDIHLKAGHPQAAREVLSRLKPFVSTDEGRLDLFMREARAWEFDQRWPKVVDALQTAARIAPTRADLHYTLAQTYEKMGSLGPAIDEIRQGRILDTVEGSKAQDAWLEKLVTAQHSSLGAPTTMPLDP